MAKYMFDCDMEHEPMHFEVEADNDEAAMTMMMEKVGPHLGEMHPDMSDKSDEENMEFIKSKWHKEEGEEGGEMPAEV